MSFLFLGFLFPLSTSRRVESLGEVCRHPFGVSVKRGDCEGGEADKMRLERKKSSGQLGRGEKRGRDKDRRRVSEEEKNLLLSNSSLAKSAGARQAVGIVLFLSL